MTLKSKNGRAYLIIPDSLLFSDSIQLIETRKYFSFGIPRSCTGVAQILQIRFTNRHAIRLLLTHF